MRRNPFVAPRIPAANAHTDIESWTLATCEAFEPFVKRRTVLKKHRNIFRVELINLIPILDDPESIDALKQAVRLCRRAIYSDPGGAYAYQISRFPEISQADGRWLSLSATMRPLDQDSDLFDRATQLFMLIDGIIEGCLKPRIALLYGFAHRLASDDFPVRTPDLGECIANWPTGQAPTLRRIMSDRKFGLPVSQWRNIAAHRSYARIGPDLFEAAYGRRTETTIQLSIDDLETVSTWAQQLIGVCRMAQVIISIEYMSELKRFGLPSVPIRFDAFIIILSHNLRMVGFTYAFEKQSHKLLVVYFRDDLDRHPRDAIIHASQVLDQMALAISSDLKLEADIEEVGIGLVSAADDIYAQATVKVDMALQWLNRELTLNQYAETVNFRFAPGLKMGG